LNQQLNNLFCIDSENKDDKMTKNKKKKNMITTFPNHTFSCDGAGGGAAHKNIFQVSRIL